MTRDFHRVAIVNRGEAAMRLVHAVRELEAEQRTGLLTIALFTEPDRHAMFVREADEAIGLGPALVPDPATGGHKSAYLDYAALERALRAARAEAAWVGWGFVAEHAEFADLCQRLGIVFIGPDPATMRRLGDKIAAKRLAEQAGVAVVEWSGGAVASPEEAERHAQRLGYPILIKASAGGGGRGIREVRAHDDLAAAFASARSEAAAAFGDATVLVERCVEGAHHVEVQIIADRHGSTWAVGVRDCTLQRRHQKVLEESPSPVLDATQDRELRDAAVRLASAAGYHGAGTVEFLYEPARRRFAFMEVNARLQVEHPVSEMTSGLDLVKLQIHVARGGRLQGEPPPSRGHAVEVRLCAEDPENRFAPAPGRIELLRLATGPGLRFDTGVAAGDSIAAEFDSMIAKLIAHGRDREEAMARLRRALAESTVVIRGGASNKAFLLALLDRPEVRSSQIDNHWLDRLAERGEHVVRTDADVALLAAAIEAHEADSSIERARFLASAARGRPSVDREIGIATELRCRGETYRLAVRRVGPWDYRVDPGDAPIDLRIERSGELERTLLCFGRRFRVLAVAQDAELLVEVEGVPHRISRDAGGAVRSPVPAMVLAVAVEPGMEVARGDRVAVLEAMKMEVPVLAPFAGRVRQVLVTANVQVGAGTPLLLLETPSRSEPAASAERVHFRAIDAVPTSPPSPQERWSGACEELRRMALGFDVEAREAKRIVGQWGDLCRALPADDAVRLRGEVELLTTFADVHALFRRQAADDAPEEEAARRSPQEYLDLYLRALDARGDGLPPVFLDRLRRTLAHYGVASLEHTRELEEALVRIHKSRTRGDEQAAAVLAVLECRLAERHEAGDVVGEAFRAVLDRLIATAHGRFAAVEELAREVRYRFFDEPLFEQARRDVYDRAGRALEQLASERAPRRRQKLIAALVECPQPLVGLIAGRFAQASEAMRETMLEVLTRRYYRIRTLENVVAYSTAGQSWVTAQYGHEGRRVHLVTSCGALDRVAAALAGLRDRLREVPPGDDVLVDFYVWHSGALPEPDDLARELREAVEAAHLPRPLRRVVFAVAGAGRGHGMGGMLHFSYRPTDRGYAEEAPHRGLHPMMGKRMHLWRLSNFEIDRLPSAEDVYLFRAVGRTNPKDERLFAIAEVRDVTPVRDPSGRIVQLPHLERMLLEALAGIRLAQARRPAGDRLQWNRILLYVWPPLLLGREELTDVARRLAPLTAGLGLEQVAVRARILGPSPDTLEDTVIRISYAGGGEMRMTFSPPPTQPLRELGTYEQKVVSLRRRGLTYPYELVAMLAPGSDAQPGDLPPGDFTEYDLDDSGRLAPVSRPHGENTAHVVVGVIRSFTAKHPEGMKRVVLLGDASKEMGSVAEPECRRILAALDLARDLGVPLEWFTLSAGAKISMESGTENMDWIARVLRRLIEFTQAGGEVNVIVVGINVGAQPYWNAEATMLMHTRGILVMTADSAMVLTGKQALDYSGSVSAEDNQGIGGYERIMGPNGQAQYYAESLVQACRILMRHYDHTYITPGERLPRRASTTDATDRDVRLSEHEPGATDGFATVGDVFGDEKNPGRKKPFDIRRVMAAVVDRDHEPLERWRDMRDAEIAVIWDAHLGGYPVCLIGMESRPLRRLGFVPADGPDQWTAGTLFPRSSKKVARAINAASGNRPLVVLANLSGFDGSPESMRNLQLEYGAEIGRAVVNFRGPMVFCVISRYHGGAFVVFSRTLNESLESAALEGAYASVIGGAPAAAVVFAREVDARTRKDARLRDAERALAAAAGPEEKSRLRARLAELAAQVRSEKLGEMAEEFDHVHSVERALRMGSLDHILPAARLRPYLVEAIERGIRKAGA